ncbi:MAG TPA: ATP-binding protein, partial [Rugosimonospora sp.]|nr:ATP-binding protein [Rugosimonospora sp.]
MLTVEAADMAGTLRDALVNWLRPAELIPTRPAIPAAYGSPTPYRPALEAGSDRAEHPRDGQPWPLICEQIALRVLAASYQLAEEVEAAEAGEEDQGRLERLYRIDHAVTRIRRQAEILQVLSGRPIEDVRRQVTSVLDVIRAAASAVDHYQRLHIGHTVDLAVVDFAADDLIRMLTELLDNAAHFAPPAATAMISAHLTESGSVLLRLEDRGVGVPPEQLLLLNELLCGGPVPTLSTQGELRLGLQVVAKLAAAHGMGVSLFARPGGGLTATILVPAQLVCEVP